MSLKQTPAQKLCFDEAHRALDFALRLWRVSPADSWRDPNGGHEVRKARVPARDLALHLHQQHTLHAISQCGLGQPSEVFKRLHQTADQRGAITALDERDKAHARVAEDGGKPIDLAGHAVLLILELAPVKLHLLCRPGFKALHRGVSRLRGSQGVHKGFEHTQASPV